MKKNQGFFLIRLKTVYIKFSFLGQNSLYLYTDSLLSKSPY